MAGSSTGPRSVPEISEAIELFEKWERSINDPAAATGLRMSNTRQLLQLLSRVDRTNFSVWLEYALAVAAVVDKEAHALMAANPELKSDFDAFMGVWREALLDAMQRAQSGG